MALEGIRGGSALGDSIASDDRVVTEEGIRKGVCMVLLFWEIRSGGESP